MSRLEQEEVKMPGELLTAKTIADRLQVHLMTVYRWIAAGYLEARQLPSGRLRIEAKELDRLLAKTKGGTKRCQRVKRKN